LLTAGRERDGDGGGEDDGLVHRSGPCVGSKMVAYETSGRNAADDEYYHIHQLIQ
jgi:hypothetical protein